MILYGAPQGRASRSLFALEELGLDYQLVALRPWESAQDRETLLGLNPNGRVPVLDDDGVVLWESMAINLYLAERAGGPCWPPDPASRGRICQWSIWAQTEIDVVARHRARHGDDAQLKAAAEAQRLAALTILDRALAGRPYLLGETFTLADLNVAATLVEPQEHGLIDGDLDPARHGLDALAGWLARCFDRDSWRRVYALA
jgi:glutathione S-transferase